MSELPSLTASLIWVRMVRKARLSVCSIRPASAGTSGMPAPSRVASWRVATCTSCGRTRPPSCSEKNEGRVRLAALAEVSRISTG